MILDFRFWILDWWRNGSGLSGLSGLPGLSGGWAEWTTDPPSLKLRRTSRTRWTLSILDFRFWIVGGIAGGGGLIVGIWVACRLIVGVGDWAGLPVGAA